MKLTKFFAMILSIFAMVTMANAEVHITVVRSEQVMYVDTPQGSFVWDVSTGRKGFTTPLGKYKPYLLKKMHYSSKYENAPMPHSIFYHGGYAIHATEAVGKLGRPASHGCIRLHPRNARWLFRMVADYGKDNTFIRIVP
jgi:lipoprotein-anchoring transpeptidase ErfK/SrfK